jgi:hypothetical protein
VPCAVVLLALVAAAAGAGSRPLPADGGPLRRLVVAPHGIEAVAYAGTTRLYAGGGTLWRLTPEGRPLRVARLPGSVNQIEASPDLVALVVQRGSVLRLLAGPPTGRLRMLAKCRGLVPELPFTPMAVAGDVVAEALSCPRGLPQGAPATRIHVGDAVRLEPAPRDRLVVTLAGTPGVLAAITARATDEIGDPAATVRIEVRSTATGALLYAVDVGNANGPGLQSTLAVQQDGTTVFCGPHGRLAWASPSAPAVHELPGLGCPYSHDLAIARGVVLYRPARKETLQTTVLATGRSRALLPDTDHGLLPFAWDGHTALVRGLDCADDFLGAVRANAAPYRGPECDVRILGARPEHGRRIIAVTLACATGCRGSVQFWVGSVGLMPPEEFHLHHGGRTTIRIRLRPHARRMLRHYRSLPFIAIASYVNPRAPGGESGVEHRGRLAGDGRRRYVSPPPPASD